MGATSRRIAAGLLLGLVGVAGWRLLLSKGEVQSDIIEAPEREGSRGQTNAPAIPVEVDTAQIGNLVMRLSTTGRTRALRAVTIAPKAGGQVVRLAVTEGQWVQKGELLFKLDDREAELALAEARDELLGKQVQYGMLLREERRGAAGEGRGGLAAKDSGSLSGPSSLDPLLALRKRLQEAEQKLARGEMTEDEFGRVQLEYVMAEVFSGEKREALMAHQSGYTRAKLAVERAQLQLRQTEVRAPFSGVVADLQVAAGEQVAAGRAACMLVDLSQIEVALQVLESEIGLVEPGRKAELSFPAFPDETFRGRVVSINPVIDLETKTVRVTVRLDNPAHKILPGMFAYAKLEAQVYENRLLVPKDAILIRDQRKLVFIVRDGLAKWCYVETGLENEALVEILSSTFGLKPGELVITGGHYTLVHDARVRY